MRIHTGSVVSKKKLSQIHGSSDPRTGAQGGELFISQNTAKANDLLLSECQRAAKYGCTSKRCMRYVLFIPQSGK